VTAALEGQKAGHMLPWVVRELSTDTIVGSTRYSHIVREIDRVEIGYTFYAQRWAADARQYGVQAPPSHTCV
jgi:RimJ/RimL family protein N-acetyltransferase